MPDGDSPTWDFYVSYTQSDRAWAEWIAWQVEEAGHRVLIQAWNTTPGDNWVDRMLDGVGRATRTIAVLSPEYLTSVYASAEWQAAWRQDPVGAERKLLPVRVHDTERPGLLASIPGVDLFGLTEAAARRRLNEAIAQVTAGRAKPPARPSFPPVSRALHIEPRFPEALPEIWNLPSRNPNFAGRDADLARLRQSVREHPGAAHAISGMGGSGKSQLVIEYAYRYASDYDIVWWVPAEVITIAAGVLADLAVRMGLPVSDSDADVGTAVQHLHAQLRGTARWLLIFDNAESPEQIRDLLPSAGGDVLITTRRRGFSGIAWPFAIDILHRDESIALLGRRLPGLDVDEAGQLADVLGDLPLALEQAAAYLRATGMPAIEYLHLLRTRMEDLIDRGTIAGRTDNLASLWQLSYDRIEDEDPAAIQLLRICAWLAPKSIPIDLFVGHPDLLPEPLRAAAADQLTFAGTVGMLVDYSLVRRAERHLSLHTLIQVTTRQQTSAAAEPLGAALQLLRRDLPNDIIGRPDHWPRWAELLPHVLVATEHPDAAASAPARTAWLLDRAGTYLQNHGQPESAEALLRRALEITVRARGDHHPIVAVRLNNLGTVLRDLGRPAEARPLLDRALTILEAAYGPEHADIATTLNNMALTMHDLGETQAAVPLFERALTLTEQNLGPDHPSTATRLNNLASALSGSGDTAAHDLIARALAITEAAYGPDHPYVATRLNNLALALHGLGRADAALDLLRRALAINEAAYGSRHPIVGLTLDNLAGVLADLGEHEASEDMRQRAATIRNARD